jgi:hypothetical protein
MSNGTALSNLDRNKLYGGLRGLEPFYASLQNLRPAQKTTVYSLRPGKQEMYLLSCSTKLHKYENYIRWMF